jgi:transcriptional regulator with XRE-family HTH domain
MVDKLSAPGSIPDMQLARDPVGALLQRARAHLVRRGSQARLARDLCVTRQAVSNWLSGNAAPSAEAALRLLQWVGAEEVNKKRSGSASPPPEQKTQSKASNEKNQKSSPKAP